MAAAAKSYFGKSLADLTLAQDALLAAIPQSPTKFDLVRNAQSVCLEDVAAGRRLHEVQARGPAWTPRSSSGATTSST